jgi:hypothetical protein
MMLWGKLHYAQHFDNEFAALKPAIALAARTSSMPSDEYSN